MKNIKLCTALIVMLFCISFTAMAEAQFSEYWYQDAAGSWHIADENGTVVKNAWLCDDAVPSNGKDIWYLIDANGNMISAGLVKDGTGNYYSLEMNHNGHYGMLRYLSGSYTADGFTAALTLDANHNGSFAAIKNADGIEALKSKYGVKEVNIDNSNIVYTSQFGKKPAQAAAAGKLTMDDFKVTGASVPASDIASYLNSKYGSSASAYFYYDSWSDQSRESVVKTARGITLANVKQDVINAYGAGTPVDAAAAKGSGALSVPAGYDPEGFAAYAKTCLKYETENGKYAIYFCFKDNSQLSYIIFYEN